MLTVMELLSFPLFRNFRLASGRGGLYNQVSGTGIFEWESSNEVEKNFGQGEFVVTTLSLARSDSALAENSIRMLIDQKVSAIAVKEIYFQDLSEKLKAYSDARRVPVFFFSETFFDDIIYTIRNSILTDHRDFNHDEQMEFLLDDAHSSEQRKRKAREINPFFHSNIICCYGSSRENNPQLKNPKAQQLNLKAPQLNLIAPQLDPEETVYSIIDYLQGILVIFTTKKPEAQTQTELMRFLEQSGLRKSLNFIGISHPSKGLENLGTAVRESLYAFESGCQAGRDGWIRYQDTGLDQILLPLAGSPWVKRYYENMLAKLTGYDERHGSRLLETLLEYIGSNGDMKVTAQRLFQHSNTIRYRIGKIRTLLNLEDDAGSYAQLVVLVRLYRIYQNSFKAD